MVMKKKTLTNEIVDIKPINVENENKELETAIFKIAGEDGKRLYSILKEKNNISEFDLAEKLNLTINQVRNVLYKFDKYGLVSSTRKKDRKKGWYIYYWTFNPYKGEDLIITIKKDKLKKYKALIEREKSTVYYSCHKKCMRLNFEMAFENQFHCLECGQLLQPEDSEKSVGNLKKEITVLEEEIKKLVVERQARVFEEEKKVVKRKVKKKVVKKKQKLKKKVKKIAKKKVVKKKTKKVVKKKVKKKQKPKKKSVKNKTKKSK